MKTQAEKVADFRNRITSRTASWAIEIAPKVKVTLDLTRKQQALLKRATRRVFPSITVVFHSNSIEPPAHATLCCLEVAASVKAEKPRARRPASKLATKSTQASR